MIYHALPDRFCPGPHIDLHELPRPLHFVQRLAVGPRQEAPLARSRGGRIDEDDPDLVYSTGGLLPHKNLPLKGEASRSPISRDPQRHLPTQATGGVEGHVHLERPAARGSFLIGHSDEVGGVLRSLEPPNHLSFFFEVLGITEWPGGQLCCCQWFARREKEQGCQSE